MKNKFKIKLKELRQEKNLTQKQLAKLLNMEESTYVKYEQGKNEPSLDTLILISDFFKVPTDYLLGILD